MFYFLTLTASERHAIDWIGHRYDHGYDLYKLLWVHCESEGEWDSPDEITFQIPEAVSWLIAEMGENCGHRWDNFSPNLSEKLNDLCMSIV